MSSSGDYFDVTSTRHDLDEAAVEALLRGEQAPRELEPLAVALRVVHASGSVPVRPSPALAERMARGDFSDVPLHDQSMIGRAMQRLARLSIRAKIASVIAVGITGASGVAAAGALPDAAQAKVENVVEAVTPIEFSENADFGQDVADDARDGGVDGQEIADEARERGAANRPTTPAHPPANTPPVTLPDVVPTDPPNDAPRQTPPVPPQVDPPKADATENHPTSRPDVPLPAPDDATNDGGRDMSRSTR